jgi:hypothetical protein
MRAILLALSLVAGTAQSAELIYVTSGWASKHFNADRSYNERNYGIGVQRQVADDWSVSAGVYRNSLDRTTVYVGGTWTPIAFGSFRAGVFGGLATGYDYAVVPFGGPMLEARIGRVMAQAVVIPPVGEKAPSTVLALRLGIGF